MAWPPLDTFTDIDGTALSDHTSDSGDTWTAQVRNLEITNENRVMSNGSSSTCEATINVTPPSADYEVSGHIHFKTVAGRIGLWARRLSNASTGYMLRYTDNTWQLLRWDAGTAVVLDSAAASVVINTDYEMKLRVEGSTLSGFIDDVEVVSAIDATYGDAGVVGIYSHGNGAAPTDSSRAHLGDFTAQSLSSGSEGIARAVPSTASLIATANRSVPATAALSESGETRTISSVTAALSGTANRSVPASVSLLSAGPKLAVQTGKQLNTRLGGSSYNGPWIYLSTAEGVWTHTYDGVEWGDAAHGKLFNMRAVQAAFAIEDEGDYPAPFDPAQNTADFIAALDDYKAHGVLAVTIGMQGGNPNIGSNGSSFDIGAFNSDGSLRAGSGTARNPETGTWLHRLNLIMQALRERGMVCILNLFYHGQDQRLSSNNAVRAAVDNVVDWLVDAEHNYADPYEHVMIDIANEYDIPGSNPLGWQRSVISTNGSGSVTGNSDEIAGLIIRIKERYTLTHGFDWWAPTGTSTAARASEKFTNNLKKYADVCFPHGNVYDDWEDPDENTYDHMVALRASIDGGTNPDIPIVMNEDDNRESTSNGYVNDTNRDAERHALLDCFNAGVSWGFMVDFYNQKYDLGLDTGWWAWSVGTAGVEQASRTEADYLADVLVAIQTTLSSSAVSKTVPATAALSGTFSRTLSATAALTNGALQTVRPIADVSVGEWTRATGGGTNLYAFLDEETLDTGESDYVVSGEGADDDVLEVRLDELATPGRSDEHTLTYWYRKDDGDKPAVNLRVDLVDGTTIIASQTHTNIPAVLTEGVLTLTENEAGAISDYTDLRVRFTRQIP